MSKVSKYLPSQKIELQVLDFFSCIDDTNQEELDKYIENGFDDDQDPNNNLYCYTVQRVLSRQNNQLIKIFGRTEKDQSVLINVSGFYPFFYLGFEENINDNDVSSIIFQLKQKVPKYYQNHIIEHQLVYRQPYEKFVGNNQFPYIKLSFKNKYSFKAFEQAAQRDKVFNLSQRRLPYFVGESNLDEILKMIHQTNIRPCSWIEVSYQKLKLTNRTAYVDIEIDTNVEYIKPVNKITNCPFKIMMYDLECASQLGETGDFPVAKKNYQKLARELIDLWSSNQKHHLIKSEITFHKVIETCLRLVFTPYFYSFGINQIITINQLKPLPILIEQIAIMITNIYQSCQSRQDICDDCISQLGTIISDNFPPAVNQMDYFNLANKIWVNLGNLTKYNYNKNHTHSELFGYIQMMFQLAFEDFYDGFNFSPINLKGKTVPTTILLNNLTPEIIRIITDIKETYENKLNCLTELLNTQFRPSFPRGDSIIQIGFTLQRLGTNHPYIKGIFTLDSCQPFDNQDLIKDENSTEMTEIEVNKMINQIRKKNSDIEIHNKTELINWLSNQQAKEDKAIVIIRSFSTESEMIKAFGVFINQQDPDMIGGYNTFGFDDRYLYHRVEELSIQEAFLSQISRLKRDTATLKQPAGSDKNDDIKGKRKMETHYLDMNGRVPFDIYRIIPTIANLPEYKLNYVCKTFLNKEKNDVPPTQIPILQRGTPVDRSLIARYCIIDCVLCNRLIANKSIINNLIAMSNVSLVPIKYLLFRGQTIKGFSLVVKKCTQRGKVVRTLRADERPGLVDKYEGAIVLDPLIDIYTTPVSVADFNSLYPSSMISENISNDTLVSDPSYDNLPGFFYNTIKYDEFVFQNAKHKKTGQTIKRMEKIKKPNMRICRYVGNMKGILPEIEEELIASRKEAKRQMEYYKQQNNSAMEAAWDCQQNAYKITCNSIYGITGAGVSPIYNKDVAASITATGRRMITFSRDYVEQNYIDLEITLVKAKIPCQEVIVKKATCVYGDTDSIFVKFDIITKNGQPLTGLDYVYASMEICQRAASEISFQLKSPQNLDFEKTIYPFLLINKKMYKGNYYMSMNSPEYYEKTMGFSVKKRDSAPIAKLVVDGLTKLLFSSVEPDQTTIKNYINNEFKKILAGEYPMKYFIRTKSWKGHYSQPLQIAQHVLAMRQAIRDPGNQFQVNDRIPFVHIVNPKAILQGDRIETPDYVIKHQLALDYYYYIEKQLINPLTKLLSPNRKLGINENWLKNILKNMCQEKQHVSTIDKFLTIIPRQTNKNSPIINDNQDDVDSHYSSSDEI